MADERHETNRAESLQAHDRQVVSISRKKCKAELAVLAQGLTAYMHGLASLSASGHWKDVSQLLRVVLLVRCFNSLNLAYRILQSGYHVQSLMLLRACFEDWAAEAHVKSHPDQANKWIIPSLHPPTRAKLVNSVDEPHRAKIRNTLRTLDNFVHPRRLGVWQIVDVREEEPYLKLGGYPNVTWVRRVTYPFLYLVSLSLHTVDNLHEELGAVSPTEWVQEADAFHETASTWIEGYHRWIQDSRDLPAAKPRRAVADNLPLLLDGEA